MFYWGYQKEISEGKPGMVVRTVSPRTLGKQRISGVRPAWSHSEFQASKTLSKVEGGGDKTKPKKKKN